METNRKLSWHDKKEILKKVFPIITENDLQFNDGKQKVMIEKLAYKIGKSEEELRYFLHDIS
jgi:hypothetical protein